MPNLKPKAGFWTRYTKRRPTLNALASLTSANLRSSPCDSECIRALREHLKLSQTVLASVLNTSASTVRKWEIGEKHPSGPSLKLLDLLERKGLDAVL